MGGGHAIQVKVRMNNMPGKFDVHLVQPMDIGWNVFLWKLHQNATPSLLD